jgi:hypothetical protein
MAVAAVLLVAGMAVLFNMDLRFVDRSSPDAVADYFMESWVAGDGEAAASMFTAQGRFDSSAPGMFSESLEPGHLPALHDWYRAIEWVWEDRGCGRLRYTFVSCAYRYENRLTRAVRAEPVTGSFLLTISDDGIETVRNEFGYYLGWDMFLDWASNTHADDFGQMFDAANSFPFLDEPSIALWERHSEEFVDVVADLPNLMEWRSQ